MKNVVLLTIDTLRRDVLGCYGSKEGLSPFLDDLAKRSILFTKNQTVGPYTQASFPGILTSGYYLDVPIDRNLSPKRTVVAEVLKKNGIATAGFHSNPYLCSFFGWNRGWDHYYDSMDDEVDDINPYIKGNVVNQKVDAWLTSSKPADKPLFLWAHYMDVHEPYVPDRKYVEKVDPSITLSVDEMFALFKNVVLARDASDPKTVDLLRKLYWAHVIEVDEYAKEFFSILEKHGVLKDATVIVTTDHGDEFGDHGSLSHDGKFYSELTNCPLIVHDTGKPQGSVCDTVVSGVDIPPTILSLFGLAPEAAFQGQSLLPVESYESKGAYGDAMGKLSHRMKETDKPAYYYREGDLKVTYREEDDQWALYDLAADPGERNNVIDTSPEAARMKAKLQPRVGRPSL